MRDLKETIKNHAVHVDQKIFGKNKHYSANTKHCMLFLNEKLQVARLKGYDSLKKWTKLNVDAKVNTHTSLLQHLGVFVKLMCVCVCVCVCVFTSIHPECFIGLEQLECHGINQRCFVIMFLFFNKPLYHYFRINQQVFLTSHFILFPQ